jgi:elongation factor G
VCGSAFKNKGVQAMLDGVIDCCRRRSTCGVTGTDVTTKKKPDPQGRRQGAVLGAGLQDHDRPVRRPLTFFRVYSGVLNLGRHRLQLGQGQEGAHRPYPADARQQPRRNQGSSGRRHRRCVGLKDVTTGDTLCAIDADHPGAHGLPGAGDLDGRRAQDQGRPGKDGPGPGSRLAQEDPSFRVDRRRIRPDHHLGMGELHLDIIVDRMKREFNVEANVGKPQVAYRETITQADVKSDYKFAKQSGGKGQYGHVVIELLITAEDRADRKSAIKDDFLFINDITGGVIPKEFIPRSKRACAKPSPAARWLASRSWTSR